MGKVRVCEQIAPAAATFSRSQSITCVKGDSFWGSFRCTLSEGKIPVPEEAPWTPRTQHWRGFQPHVKKSLAPCRPERAGGKVIVFGEPGRLSPPEGDNFWGRAARLWTVRRRLSNVARGAAEGLEGPAGTERLYPTHRSRSIPRRLNGRFEGGAATCEPSTSCCPSAKLAIDVAPVDGQMYGRLPVERTPLMQNLRPDAVCVSTSAHLPEQRLEIVSTRLYTVFSGRKRVSFGQRSSWT